MGFYRVPLLLRNTGTDGTITIKWRIKLVLDTCQWLWTQPKASRGLIITQIIENKQSPLRENMFCLKLQKWTQLNWIGLNRTTENTEGAVAYHKRAEDDKIKQYLVTVYPISCEMNINTTTITKTQNCLERDENERQTHIFSKRNTQCGPHSVWLEVDRNDYKPKLHDYKLHKYDSTEGTERCNEFG